MKAWIDLATYEQLLDKFRIAPIGSPWFKGEIGEYYSQKLVEKRKEVGNVAAVAASKLIGWDKQ